MKLEELIYSVLHLRFPFILLFLEGKTKECDLYI